MNVFGVVSVSRARLLLARAVEPETDEEAVLLAYCVYWESRAIADGEADGTDNLAFTPRSRSREDVATLASKLASELRGETPRSRAGRMRLAAWAAKCGKWDDRAIPIYDRHAAVVDQLDGLIDSLDALSVAAAEAHQRTHGNTKKKDLRAAYTVLSAYWKRTRPENPITASFVADDGEPNRNTAADWLLEALRAIDPARDRLKPELKHLITKHVAVTLGPRRGRAGTAQLLYKPKTAISDDFAKVYSLVR
jgi:hypothetical protein